MQRFFIALRPTGGRNVRLCVAGRKRLPDLDGHERVWGFVDMVTDDERKIERELREEHYDNRTRGEQEQPAARPADAVPVGIAVDPLERRDFRPEMRGAGFSDLSRPGLLALARDPAGAFRFRQGS